MLQSRKNKIFFACSGVGHIRRGYETHMIDLYDQLIAIPDLDLTLLKGGGKSQGKIKRIYCIQRHGYLANFISKISGKPGYMIEQISFFLLTVYYIIVKKPDTIYSPDFTLLRLYVILKKLSGLKYKTIFCNGGNYKPPYYGIDIVQFILPQYANGIDFGSKVIIPHGFSDERFTIKVDKNMLRNKFGLPLDKKILLSVGSLDVDWKRMDLIINEASLLKREDLFIIIVGQKGKFHHKIRTLLEAKFGSNYRICESDPFSIWEYYKLADIFCLASLNETFGMVYVEALLSEIPIIAHNYFVAQEVLSEFCHYVDLTKEGNLAVELQKVLNKGSKYNLGNGREFGIAKYSWKSIKPDYLKMLLLE